MTKQTIQSLLGTAGAVIAAGLIAVAGSDGSVIVGGLPLFALCAVVSFTVQWFAFVPAYLAQTEHYFDLTGSLTYLTLITFAIVLSGHLDARALLIAALVTIWAVRLGTFLFGRVRADGFDRRFTAIKAHTPTFFMTWTLQGLWVFLTLAAALAALTSQQRAPLGVLEVVGAALWCGGFAIEVVADRQKRAFRHESANRNTFIRSGLWAWSRHPNYFGEIVLWVGVTLIALPVLSGWQWVTLISPLFVYVLLTRISGVPMLEARANKKWGDDEDYRAYKVKTPVLWPRPPG
jgi:steroid 5-alpha reductase family enzyme